MTRPFIAGSAAARRMLAMTKYAHSRLFLAALAAGQIAAVTALAVTFLAVAPRPLLAQDAMPDTPKELKNFRLDPEKAPPVREPVPTTEPVVKPPAANAPAARPPAAQAPVVEVPVQVPNVRVPAARTPAARPGAAKPAVKPSVAPSVTPSDKPNAPAAGAPDAVPAPEPAAQLPEFQPQASQPQTSQPEAAPSDNAPAPALPWSYILAALLAAIGVGAAIFFKRRRSDYADVHGEQEAIFEPTEDPADGHHIAATDPVAELDAVIAPLVPAPVSVIPAPVIRAPISANRPKLDISFVPEKASISLANLTIKGRLHIVNNGADVADAMQLNAAVISASEGQGLAISRYFTSALPTGKELGAAKVGEQIALEMDLMIPIADLQTFVMGKQKLLVPIILARVEYQWGDAKHADEAQLSCLIGREASPPKPKMGALRLDLGPRSFASLGQRPLPG
jgi:hypothetical protein